MTAVTQFVKLNFNSTKVRLKLNIYNATGSTINNFNSTKVRLKREIDENYLQIHKFQFH